MVSPILRGTRSIVKAFATVRICPRCGIELLDWRGRHGIVFLDASGRCGEKQPHATSFPCIVNKFETTPLRLGDFLCGNIAYITESLLRQNGILVVPVKGDRHGKHERYQTNHPQAVGRKKLPQKPVHETGFGFATDSRLRHAQFSRFRCRVRQKKSFVFNKYF